MKTVLDLGAYNGRASEEFVEEGDRWILVDNEQHLEYDGWAKPAPPLGAEYIVMDIMDYTEPADVVVCSNVLYHVLDPHALLRHLKELTLKTLVLKTYFDPPGEKDWNYYGEKKQAHPHLPTANTIFYRPTLDGLTNELKSLGFKNLEIKFKEMFLVTITCEV